MCSVRHRSRLLGPPPCAIGEVPEDVSAALKEQITELRQAGAYTEALTIARARLALLKAEPGRKAWEISDAGRTVAFLE